MKFVWNEQYSVHIGMIDEQHKHYFEILNRIFDGLDSSRMDKMQLGSIVRELVDYAFYHFQTEEKFFRDFQYEGAVQHIEAHDLYRKTMKGHLQELEGQQAEVMKIFQELAQFATDWFTNHILVEDKKYSQCFIDHGLV